MSSLSTCLSFIALSACLSAVAQQRTQNSEFIPTLKTSFQGLSFRDRLIQKEYLFQKYNVTSFSALLEQQDPNYDIAYLIQCEEMAALGRLVSQSDSVSNVIHTCGLTHLEGLLQHTKKPPFLMAQSSLYQDAFQIEFMTLCDVSHVFKTEDWIPFRLRVDTELSKSPRLFSHQNTFYSDIRRQAQNLLTTQKLQAAQIRQR